MSGEGRIGPAKTFSTSMSVCISLDGLWDKAKQVQGIEVRIETHWPFSSVPFSQVFPNIDITYTG